MAKKKVNVKINLDRRLISLLRVLQRSSHLVSYGLVPKEKTDLETNKFKLGRFELIFDGKLNWSPEYTKRQHTNWILTNGFKDTIEGINIFLESVHNILSLWDLTKKPDKSVEIKGSDWNKLIVDSQKQFHRFGLPIKLEHLRDEHSIVTDSSLHESLLSANTARSCLVHRNGIVSEIDVTEEDYLKLQWI